MHHDWLRYCYWHRILHETILWNNSVCNVRWCMRIAKSKHLACMQGSIDQKGVLWIALDKFTFWNICFTSEWVNFGMSSEGMSQSLVIIQHAKCLQISIFQNFNDICTLQQRKHPALQNNWKAWWSYLMMYDATKFSAFPVPFRQLSICFSSSMQHINTNIQSKKE